jgi:zinc protease
MRGLTRITPALLAFLVVAGCGIARRTPEARKPVGPSQQILPNGVRILVEEQRTSDVVALQLWVAAGGRDETANELGLAHYLEHMLFKGTPTRPTGFIDREVEGVGGRMNAGTSLDYTYYHMLLPARRALAGIDTLADISANAALDATQLEREKRVVLEELRLGEDTPPRLLARQLYEALFTGHPYGRPVIGRADLIRALTREQLLAFYRSHYVPESLTLVVVGAVSPAEVFDAAHRAFGRLSRTGTRRLPVAAVAEARPGQIQRSRPGSYAYIGLAWSAPRLDHADTPAVDLLTAVLGQGKASRLTRVLRDGLGLVNTVAASYAALEGAGVVSITAQLDPANLARAETEILEQLRRIQRDGITDDERERALTMAEARREFQKETAEGRAFALGHAATIWRVEEELAYIDHLRTVTPEQIRLAARRYLEVGRFARVVFTPGTPR